MSDLVLHEHVAGPRGERVLVRRSARRKRTVSITRREGDLVIAIPPPRHIHKTDRPRLADKPKSLIHPVNNELVEVFGSRSVCRFWTKSCARKSD